MYSRNKNATRCGTVTETRQDIFWIAEYALYVSFVSLNKKYLEASEFIHICRDTETQLSREEGERLGRFKLRWHFWCYHTLWWCWPSGLWNPHSVTLYYLYIWNRQFGVQSQWWLGFLCMFNDKAVSSSFTVDYTIYRVKVWIWVWWCVSYCR